MSIGTSVRSSCQRADQAGEARSCAWRNFSLGVISGVAYNFNAALLGTQVVMVWYLSELTESNLLISLLLPIEIGSWYLLQPFMSPLVRRRSHVLPIYHAAGAVRVGALAALSVATALLGPRPSLLPTFLGLFTICSVAAGIAALPFLTVVTKTIPAEKRGMYFGWRRFAGGVFAVGGALFVRAVLSPDSGLGFPFNYVLLFAAGCLVTLVMVGTFSLVDEPGGPAVGRAAAAAEPLRRRLGQAFGNTDYVRYLGLQVALAVASYSLPFYAVYARRALGVSAETAGTYVMASTAASVASNLLLGWLGDRRGNRLLVRLAALTAVLPPAAALLAGRLAGPVLAHGGLFTSIFVFQGLHGTAHSIGSGNYLLELGSANEQVTYVSFAHGLIGLALLGSPLAAALVNWMGFDALFATSLMCGLTAVTLSLNLGEPRASTSG